MRKTSWNSFRLPASSVSLLFLCGLLFFAISLPVVLHAQDPAATQKARPDSAHITPTDSLVTINPLVPDSSRRVSNHTNLIDTSAAVKFSSPQIGFQTNKAATSTHFFQDFVQLAGQTLPVIPIVAGEVGQPRYLATGDLPARAVQIVVDDIRWIPGVYGNIDLTGLPDANVALLEENGAWAWQNSLVAPPYNLHLVSDSLNYGVPFSRIEYAKGPFGADAVRVRFGRALSRRLTAYLNSAFSNSDGQFVDLPYNGHKASALFDYHLTSKWRLRYRHLNSRNEAGVGVPFFPEEWPGISRAFHKEERLYHAIEANSSNHFSWRGFVWQIKEELNDPARQIPHRLRDGGMEINWLEQTEGRALKIQNRIGLEAIKSPSIDDRERLYEQLFASAGFRLAPKTWLQLAGHVAYKSDWPQGLALEAKWIAAPANALTWWLGSGFWKIPPALGERDSLSSYLSRNDDLQAVNLWRGEAGINWRSSRWDLKLRLSGSLWQNGQVFQIVQIDSLTSSGILTNSSRDEFLLGVQSSLQWKFAAQWHFGIIAAQTINGLPEDFWFWHQPEGHAGVYFETTQDLFSGDLEIMPRLAGRFIGKRFSPSFDTDVIRLLGKKLPAAAVLDLQIRLRHGDGALLFSWENVLNQQFDLRYGVPQSVPTVGRFLRWGFWWNFLN